MLSMYIGSEPALYVPGTTIVDALSDLAKNFDFSLDLGFSYDFKFGMVASLRYNIGMTQVMEKHDKFVDGSNYNRVFQFSLGWKF